MFTMLNVPNKIIVHHTADSSSVDQFNKVNEWHRLREFPKSHAGYFVGYHYLINKLGNVTQAREDDEEGAHTKGQNFSSIGVCLEGNFSSEFPTPAQKEALGNLLVKLCDRYKLASQHIHPHRSFAQKDCYGALLPDTWARLIYLQYKLSSLQKLLLWIRNKLQMLKNI